MPVRKYWTLGQIRKKIKADLDIEGETFVRESELDDYINEAIDEAEAEIHSMYEDYFLSRKNINLVAGAEEHDLPENIYAHKIRRVIYNRQSSVYTVRRVQDWKKFEKYEISNLYTTSDLYQYFIINETAGEPKMLIMPPIRDTGTYMTVWYIRQANRLEEDSDICDIPEFTNFIFQYTKVRVYEKEGHPNTAMAIQVLEQQRQLMLGTLTSMVPDAENRIEQDFSFYEEMN